MVWEYGYSGSDHDVYRRRVAGDGQLVEDERVVSGLGHNEARPHLAASGDLSFPAVWEDDRDDATSGTDIYGGLEELKRFKGRVFEGEEGDETNPLEGVAVELVRKLCGSVCGGQRAAASFPGESFGDGASVAARSSSSPPTRISRSSR